MRDPNSLPLTRRDWLVLGLPLVAALFPARADGQQDVGSSTGGIEGADIDSRRKGTPLVVDRYSPQYLNELWDLIRSEPQKTVLVVVSVPDACPFCVKYMPEIRGAADAFKGRDDVLIRVIDFDDYDEATAKMGNMVKLFPFTAVFRQGRSEGVGAKQREFSLPVLEKIGHTFEPLEGFQDSRTLLRVIDPPLAR